MQHCWADKSKLDSSLTLGRKIHDMGAQVKLWGMAIYLCPPKTGTAGGVVQEKGQRTQRTMNDTDAIWTALTEYSSILPGNRAQSGHLQAKTQERRVLGWSASPYRWPVMSEVRNRKSKGLSCGNLRCRAVFQCLFPSSSRMAWDSWVMRIWLGDARWRTQTRNDPSPRTWTRFSLTRFEIPTEVKVFSRWDSSQKTNITTVWGWTVYIFTV